jgi:hypothetical protein
LILASIFGGGVRASGMRFEDGAPVLPATLRLDAGYGHGCGWDYPCAPRPDYHETDCTERWCEEPYRAPPVRVYDEPEESYGGPCGDGPCETGCGTWCWLHRFQNGYCGHGCEFYRERADFVTDYRIVDVPRPVYYHLAYPCPVPSHCHDVPRPVYYRPPYPCQAPSNCHDVPRPAFYRPPYPCQAPNNCHDEPRAFYRPPHPCQAPGHCHDVPRAFYRPPYPETGSHFPHAVGTHERAEHYPEHTGHAPAPAPENHFVPSRRFEGPVYPAH